MSKPKLYRSKAKKWLSLSLAPIFVIIVMLYEDTVQKILEENNVTSTLAAKLGFLMTSYWGISFIALAIFICGAIATLWIEDFLDKRKSEGSAEIEFKYDINTKQLEKTRMRNISCWHRRGHNPFFVLQFHTPIAKPVVSVSSSVSEGATWKESLSNENSIFIETKGVSDASWLHIHVVESARVPDRRQQTPDKEMDVVYLSQSDKDRLDVVRDGVEKWDGMGRLQKFIHNHIKKKAIHDHT